MKALGPPKPPGRPVFGCGREDGCCALRLLGKMLGCLLLLLLLLFPLLVLLRLLLPRLQLLPLLLLQLRLLRSSCFWSSCLCADAYVRCLTCQRLRPDTAGAVLCSIIANFEHDCVVSWHPAGGGLTTNCHRRCNSCFRRPQMLFAVLASTPGRATRQRLKTRTATKSRLYRNLGSAYYIASRDSSEGDENIWDLAVSEVEEVFT